MFQGSRSHDEDTGDLFRQSTRQGQESDWPLRAATTLEQAIRRPRPVDNGLLLDSLLLNTAMAAIQYKQMLNQLTGAMHASAWLVPVHGVTKVREEVGRHNTLDKLISALAKAQCNFEQGWLRVSFMCTVFTPI